MSLRHQPPTATFSLLSINNVQPSSLFALSFPFSSSFPPPSFFFLQPSYNPSSLSTLFPLSAVTSTRFPINEGKFVPSDVERVSNFETRESLDDFERDRIDNSDSTRRKSISSIQRFEFFVRLRNHVSVIPIPLSTTIRLIMVRAIIPTAEVVLHR